MPIRFHVLVVLAFLFTAAVSANTGEIIDPPTAQKDALDWYDIKALGVEGRGFTDTKSFYDRLPAKAEGVVRPPVWSLSQDSAGMGVRFVTDATTIHARWHLRKNRLAMNHMPATGVSGLDLYFRGSDGKWNWIAAGRPTQFPANCAMLITGIPAGEREYMLYLPLYNGVTKVEIGISKENVLKKAPPYPDSRKPILFYGTSITQGGCASRTGMVHTAILGRWLNYPVINLGFSGNGHMEPEIAELLAETDPSVFVLDCLPNMNGDLIRKRLEPFVRILRAAHPETPILLVEDRTYGTAILKPSSRRANERNRSELRQAYYRLQESGVEDLHYLPGNKLLDDDIDNYGTVDGSHPTDLGFLRQARAFKPVLEKILLGDRRQVHMDHEWKRTNPDIVVYLPKGVNDGDNEHFQVFKAPKSDELLAIWTQSSVEGRGDNRAAFARSMDGVHWSDPVIIKGKGPGRENEGQASWAFPVVAKTGRIYCFYTKELEKIDARQCSGVMGTLYSDDNGYTWTDGTDIPVPKTRFDNPDPGTPPNWIVWQQPIRDAKGRWIVGYTRTTSETVIKKPNRNWPDHDSRSAFIRFDNLDHGPAPKDLKLTWLPTDTEGLEVPHKVYPQISTCQEPALVLLPDGRLFTVMRTMTGQIWYSVSDNHGETWRRPEPLRYRDGGKTVDNPIAPCPMYRLKDGRYLLVFNNNEGKRGEYDQFKKNWKVNQLNHLRHPAFIAVGAFREDAHQPIWFSEPKKILDTDGVVYGPKGTASVAMYPSLTEYRGKRVLWYPDRKHFLLGLYLTDDMLNDMEVPAKQAGASASAALTKWRAHKYGMFIHFGMATFIGRPDENDPRNATELSTLYAPTDLDVDQWIRVARDAGMKYAVLTAKHSAGHCLWDSKVQFRGKEFDYDVATSGNDTDVVAEFVEACGKYGVAPGLYWCLLDFHHNTIPPRRQWNIGDLPDDFYQLAQDQLTELITRYPEVGYYWLDIPRAAGAEQRRTLYDMIKRLRPGTIVLFNHGTVPPQGPLTIEQCDVAWPTDVLNTERHPCKPGQFASEQIWQDKTYQVGYEHCDCLAQHWFWAASDKPRPIRELRRVYRDVVAAGGNLLLNVAPDRSGRLPDSNVEALMELKRAIADPTAFPDPLTLHASVTASNYYRNDRNYRPEAAIDDDPSTRWATDVGTQSAWLAVDLGKPMEVRRVVIQQAYPELKRVKTFAVEYRQGNVWKVCCQGKDLGAILDTAIEPVTAQEFRLNITQATEGPTITEFQLFESKSQ